MKRILKLLSIILFSMMLLSAVLSLFYVELAPKCTIICMELFIVVGILYIVAIANDKQEEMNKQFSHFMSDEDDDIVDIDNSYYPDREL